MSAAENAPAQAPAVSAPAPYGFFGLIVSLFVIAAVSVAIMAIEAGLWTLVFGYGSIERGFAEISRVELNEIRNSSAHAQMTLYVLLAASFIAFGLAVLLVAWFRGGRQWRAPLFWTKPLGWPSSRGLLLLAGLALAYLVIVGLGIKLVHPGFRTWFFIPASPEGILLSFATVVLLAPWAEELVFRGWIYSSLRHSFGAIAAIALTALLFAVAHMDATGLYPVLIFIPGLILTLIREKNDSSFASFLAHASYNLLAWLIVFFVGNP